MSTRLSHSAVNTYTTCGKKYYYHYIKKLRPKVIHGALLFGSALDRAVNELLEKKDLEEAIKLFDKSYRYQPINNVPTYIPDSPNVVYSTRDFDWELLEEEDIEEYNKTRKKAELPDIKTLESIKTDFDYITDLKAKHGLNKLSDHEKLLLAKANWLAMRRKGHIMLTSYHKKVLPKIKTLLSVQKTINLENQEGDKVTGFLDFAVEWDDGRRYILDNKTSYMEYEPDSAMKSQQLILYYHAEKEELKLDGVGFIVLYKQINKNRVKKCSVCKFDGSGSRHKTCSNEVDGVRCNGAWIEKIKPEARIDFILNDVPESAENLVLQTFDEANQGIKKQAFGPNLGACMAYGSPCAYYNLCWKGKDEELVDMDKKDENI